MNQRINIFLFSVSGHFTTKTKNFSWLPTNFVSFHEKNASSNLTKFQLLQAEKKKIKKIEEDEDTDEDGNFGNHQKVTGSELTSVRNSVVVEHLVQDIQDKSSMQEFRISGFIPEQKRKSAVLESKLQEFEIEMERLGSRIEHLKSQNEVLSLTLTESKNHCDNLTVLIGKKRAFKK